MLKRTPLLPIPQTKLLKEQLNSVASMVWVVGSLIGCIMALAGLINFTNMIITNIITRRMSLRYAEYRYDKSPASKADGL